MNTDVDGLRVIVTAGARGIGFSIAEEFASGGASVAVCDVDQGALDRLRDSGSPSCRKHSWIRQPVMATA